MLTRRALEIMQSPNNIEVLYKSKPVWLENVEGSNVKVKDLTNNSILEVPVSELQETGIIK
ncbi:small, acid-soluble spore protein, H family [Caloramator sp. E03]|uniref:small, acid-soluble spore protein, H family n=1 Tax=Caloramator sp. E03 TaxID=2576307 RepID=UPI001110DE1B|nr:small, acid-soluble spore protein, H family [Caloramator sp. E03]QCX33131.1 small, acid-soluble spore protein, H family [Caloramator sp. E03]